MRITSEVMVTRSLDRLQERLRTYERTQSELASGRRILTPSDDPAGSRRALSLRASLATHERNLENVGDAIGWLDAADAQLQSVTERLSRVRELAVRGANDPSQQGRSAMATEVRHIADEIRGIANAERQGRPLFGGFERGPAVEADGAGGWQYAGAGDEVTRRVSESELVRVNVTAQEWMQGDGTDGVDDLLTVLGGLADDLEGGTGAELSARLDEVDAVTARVTSALGEVGAATNRVESAKERAEAQLLTVRTELSDVQDVDVAEGVMELQVQQVAYQATLQALGKALPPSLGAFLR